MRPHIQKTKSTKDVTIGQGEPEANQSFKVLNHLVAQKLSSLDFGLR